IVFRNLELISAFAPIDNLSDFGLDGVFVINDTASLPSPARFLNVLRQGGNLQMQWDGGGRVFQLEHADDVAGPYLPLGFIVPDLAAGDSVTTNRTKAFYRVRQW